VTGENLAEIERQFRTEHGLGKADSDYFSALLHGVPAQLDVVDEALTPFLDRQIDDLDPVERAILRIAAFELVERPDVPYKVVINEAVELAKIFGAEQSHKYVNGVLDKAAHAVRLAEPDLSAC
jgi:N utilization substance protein B